MTHNLAKLCPKHPDIFCTLSALDPGYHCYRCNKESKSFWEGSVRDKAKDFAHSHFTLAQKRAFISQNILDLTERRRKSFNNMPIKKKSTSNSAGAESDNWDTRSTYSTRSYISHASQENGMYLVNPEFSYEDYVTLVLGKEINFED